MLHCAPSGKGNGISGVRLRVANVCLLGPFPVRPRPVASLGSETPHGGAGAGGQAGSRNPIASPHAAARSRSGCPFRHGRCRPGTAAMGAACRGDQPPALRLPRVGVPLAPLLLRLPHHVSHQCVPSSVFQFISPF